MPGFDERLYWIGFSVFPGIGPKKFDQLLSAFGSAENAWKTSQKEFETVAKPAITKKFWEFKNTFSFEVYEKKLKERDSWFVTLNDRGYPKLLKEIENPPFVLYGKGDKLALSLQRSIGVVGTRKITNYGRQVTEMITAEMVGAGYCIVSGLAMGVDAVAHKTAIDTNGKTIAVLGCGVDCCSPRENTLLYENIISKGGCIVSEFPLSQNPTIGSFPSRNRIIAGLSQAVVVTEGAVDSGALITASDSLKNNRPVFAIPGPITSILSKGPNELLKKGAQLVTGGEDILRALGAEAPRNKGVKPVKGETKKEQHIIDILSSEELSFDEILLRVFVPAAQLNMLLSLMELKGIISKTQNGRYELSA